MFLSLFGSFFHTGKDVIQQRFLTFQLKDILKLVVQDLLRVLEEILIHHVQTLSLGQPLLFAQVNSLDHFHQLCILNKFPI